MKLPHRENAVIPQAKLTGYLLSPAHSSGQYKAAFFQRFGFAQDT